MEQQARRLLGLVMSAGFLIVTFVVITGIIKASL
jgi:hypothetical protein